MNRTTWLLIVIVAVAVIYGVALGVQRKRANTVCADGGFDFPRVSWNLSYSCVKVLNGEEVVVPVRKSK
jgi:hypothetical protein